MQEVVEDLSIPSAKFLPLAWQISSRLQQRADGGGPSPFQTVLNDLVEWLVRDHPFHTLYQLISLRNSEKVTAARAGAKGGQQDKARRSGAGARSLDRLRSPCAERGSLFLHCRSLRRAGRTAC